MAVGLAAAMPARVGKGSPEARALWEKGQAADKENKFAEAAGFYRQAIDADPDYLEAHQRYVMARRRATGAGADDKKPEEIEKLRKAVDQELTRLYEGWIQQHPERAVYHAALGWLTDGASSEKHYRRAVELDLQFSHAWARLSSIAEKMGDNARSLEYIEKAVKSDLDDAWILRQYAFKFQTSDPGRYRKLEMEVVKRWPKSAAAANALNSVATSLADKGDRIPYLERLRVLDPTHRGMSSLFRAYVEQAPDKALELARDMVKRSKDADLKRWQQNVAFAESYTEARRLLKGGKFGEAKAVLEKAKPPGSVVDPTSPNLMKAKATAGAGEPAKAYDELAKLLAEKPNDTLEKQLRQLGERLNKTNGQVDGDLWTIRAASATAAKELNLPQYGEENRKVNLAEYRGRVVLVNFFFPG